MKNGGWKPSRLGDLYDFMDMIAFFISSRVTKEIKEKGVAWLSEGMFLTYGDSWEEAQGKQEIPQKYSLACTPKAWGSLHHSLDSIRIGWKWFLLRLVLVWQWYSQVFLSPNLIHCSLDFLYQIGFYWCWISLYSSWSCFSRIKNTL